MKPIKRKVSNDCRKNDTKVIANHARNKQCDERITIHTKYLLNAREKSRLQGAIGLGFASHWLKNWGETFKLPSPLHSFFFYVTQRPEVALSDIPKMFGEKIIETAHLLATQ